MDWLRSTGYTAKFHANLAATALNNHVERKLGHVEMVGAGASGSDTSIVPLGWTHQFSLDID